MFFVLIFIVIFWGFILGGKVKIISVLFLTIVFLGGCVSTKYWSATGGSRADGVVRLAFNKGTLQRVQLDESQAISVATERCKNWGYNGAEAFGGVTYQCIQTGQYGCVTETVTKEYQCVNN